MHISWSELWVRSLSALLSIVATAVLYLLAVRLFSRRTAIIAVLLLCVNRSDIAYAQEARSYALVALLVTCSFLWLVFSAQHERTRDLVAYVLTTALAAYAHFIALFVIVPQAIWWCLIPHRRFHLRHILWAGAAFAVLLFPIAWFMFGSRLGLVQWIQPPTFIDLAAVIAFVALPGWRAATYLTLWIIAWVTMVRRSHVDENRALTLITLWLTLPIVIALAVSQMKPMLVSRFFIVCVPAGVLLAAEGINRLPRRLMWPAMTIALIVSFNAALGWYRHPQSKEDLRGVTRYVEANAQNGDELIVEPAYARFTVDYYRDIYGTAGKQLIAVDLPANSDVLPARHSSRVWLVVRGAYGSNTVANDALRRSGLLALPEYCQAETKQFNMLELWRFERC